MRRHSGASRGGPAACSARRARRSSRAMSRPRERATARTSRRCNRATACAPSSRSRGSDHGSRGRVSCPMPIPVRWLVALTLCLAPAIATAQGTAVAPQVVWWPRAPLQGSLVRVVVRVPSAAGDSVTAVSGELAGEPLHFERFADGFQALGAVPFVARDSAAAHVVVERAGVAGGTLLPALPVARRRVARERLRVAPQVAQPPQASAERIQIEQAMVQEVRQRAHETPRLWQGPVVGPGSGPGTGGGGGGGV